jgi:hypothetical protein
MVRKDIPYLAIGSSKSIPRRPKRFVEIPVVPAVEQDELTEHTDNKQKQETRLAASSKVADASSDMTTESVRERYPYGYSGELSGECEIPFGGPEAGLRHLR